MGQHQITPQPLKPLSLWRKLLRKFPHFCSYCGRHYVTCYSRKPSGMTSSHAPGRCCPNGHEGYVDEFIGATTVRKKFDLVRGNSQ